MTADPSRCGRAELLPTPLPGVPERLRLALYTLVVVAVCTVTMGDRLGEGTLNNDESNYAGIVDHVADDGDWLLLVSAGNDPYLNKPGLPFWLAAATRDLFDDGPLRYRLWSCVLAIATVAMTVLLGGGLFGAEVGLVAGLMLAVHPELVFIRYARFFSLDPYMVFFSLWVWIGVGLALCGRRRSGWTVVGVAAAGLSLTKPLGGLPFVAGAGMLAAAFDRGGGTRAKWTGPLLALGICVALAGPWYLAQHLAYGSDYWDTVVGRNLVRRMTVGTRSHVEPWWFYARAIPASSLPFLAAWPAVAGAAALAWRGPPRARRAFAAVAVLSVGLVLPFSVSTAKVLRYAYPAFPWIAIAIAAVGAWGLARVTAGASETTRRAVAGAAVALALLASGAAAHRISTEQVPHYVARFNFLPWWLHTFTREHGQGEVPFLAVDYPRRGRHNRDYYWSRMRHRVEDVPPEALAERLARPGPAVLVLPRDEDARPWAHAAEDAGFVLYGGFRDVIGVRGLRTPLPDWMAGVRVEAATFPTTYGQRRGRARER